MRLGITTCAFTVLLAFSASAARPDYSALLAALDRDGFAIHQETGVRVASLDFVHEGKNVEVLSFTPPGSGPFPALLLLPGYGSSARDWTVNGLFFAKAGYHCYVVAQPGFGKSDGPSDFVGPSTVAALTSAWERLRTDPLSDPESMGIVGYSRGAMAASILACQLAGVKAVVLGAGIYDFRKAFDEIRSPIIRTNMLLETGGSATEPGETACEQRSSILLLDKLTASVLILHGDQDANAPVSQAYLLRDKLRELGKDFEIHIVEGKEHSIGLDSFQQLSLEFLGRTL